MNKDEAAFTTRAKAWIKSELPTCAWEVKHTRGKTKFTLSELKEHQINWLVASTKKSGCSWKIPDTGYGYNPFDGFNLKGVQAFVIIAFPTWVVAIEIQTLLLIKEPSITEEKARRISLYSILTRDI